MDKLQGKNGNNKDMVMLIGLYVCNSFGMRFAAGAFLLDCISDAQ